MSNRLICYSNNIIDSYNVRKYLKRFHHNFYEPSVFSRSLFCQTNSPVLRGIQFAIMKKDRKVANSDKCEAENRGFCSTNHLNYYFIIKIVADWLSAATKFGWNQESLSSTIFIFLRPWNAFAKVILKMFYYNTYSHVLSSSLAGKLSRHGVFSDGWSW